MAIFLLLIFCCLNFSTCRTRVVKEPVLIGDARIVGKIVAGAVVFEPKENPNGDYYIVTSAYVRKMFYLAITVSEQAAEIKRLEALIHKDGSGGGK